MEENGRRDGNKLESGVEWVGRVSVMGGLRTIRCGSTGLHSIEWY